LLSEGTPVEVGVQIAAGERYVVAEYASVPPALSAILSNAALPIEREQTFLWLRSEDDLLAKTQLIANARSDDGTMALDVQQSFTSYGAEIAITAPPSEMISS
jgi:hypothetical protein